ncbi:MAG: putative aminohydrolase SsnA [Spirochaetes bacterium]|nr:putative aminohydrolase SsnA [Spirochaetota bacterium]
MLILKNANILQIDPPRIEQGVDIVVEGNKIKAVGSKIASQYQADKIMDMTGKLVMPGIVCSHNHFYSGLARGIIARIPPSHNFYGILQTLWWRLDRAIDEEILYYSGLVCSLDAIKGGCTSVIDHHASPAFINGSLNVLKKGFEKAGLRGITCYEVTNRNGGAKEEDAGVAENIDFAKACEADKKRNPGTHLVEAMIGGHAPFTITDDGLKKMGDAVASTGRGVHIHVAEDAFDVSHSHGVYKKNILTRLDDFGLLNDKALIVHGVHLIEDDVNLLNERNAFLATNARSNMNNQVGYCQYLGNIKNLVLGTDGIGANMFEETKFAFFKQREALRTMWENDYVKFLSNGNRILERYFDAPFGKLEPGYQADLTILDYHSSTPLTKDNIGGHFIYGMNSHDVESVIVNGNIVLENRQFPFEVASIYEEAQKHAQRLWDNMNKID